MNLRRLDLNLLVILDALLDEAHVSRAAARVGLSQSATSSALDRCRQLFGDPLLERGLGGMRRTARAEALRVPLREALAGIARVVTQPAPELRQLQQAVRLRMADALYAALVPPLRSAVAAAAPGIDLLFLPWTEAEAAASGAAKGSVDVIVAPLSGPELKHLTVEHQVRDRYILAMRRGHPAAQDGGLDAWLAYPHLVVSARGAQRTGLDDKLAAIGRERRIAVAVPSFVVAPALLVESDLIALLPSLAVRGEQGADLHLSAPPLQVDDLLLSVAWAKRCEHDPGVRFVAAEVTAQLTALIAP